MTEIAIKPTAAEVMENVIIKGDLAQLEPFERVVYYREICRSVGLNELTKPFEYIRLSGKLTLYALKGATDQLRALHKISIGVPKIDYVDDLVIVSVVATDKTGRTDADSGAVAIAGLKGEAKANAVMKAITKSKRRVTLSMCGLGMLDETEVETIPEAQAWVEPTPEQPRMVTAAQVKAIAEAFNRGQFTDGSEGRADTKAFVAWVVGLGEPVGIKALTFEQAEHLLRTIGTRASFDATFQTYTEKQAGREYDAQVEQTAA